MDNLKKFITNHKKEMSERIYYILDGKQRGPFPLEDLLRTGILKRDTMVWYEGLPDWTPAWKAPLTAPHVGSVPPGFNRTSADGYLPVKPSSYLVLSIICTILCCLPAGIVAIVYSCKVNSLWDSGEYAKATAASRNALTWILVSAGVSLAWIVLSVALKLSFLPYAVLMN